MARCNLCSHVKVPNPEPASKVVDKPARGPFVTFTFSLSHFVDLDLTIIHSGASLVG